MADEEIDDERRAELKPEPIRPPQIKSEGNPEPDMAFAEKSNTPPAEGNEPKRHPVGEELPAPDPAFINNPAEMSLEDQAKRRGLE